MKQKANKKFSCNNKSNNTNNDGNMSWWKQVRCDLAQQQDTTAECITSNNGVVADMNGSNGNCSCHKQRRCNRLTCYRNGKSSGSNHRKALLLFITMAVLLLATPPTKAGVLKRSIAETITDMNLTTLSTPLDEAVENSPTTVITPLLANNQTTLSNVQQNVATATVVNEPETTTVGTSTVQHDDQIMALNLPQGVKNEIAQVVSKEAATDLRVKANSKFDYTETVLDENLEDSIRNSVRNEIEFEQDIIAAEVQHLQNVTDEEVRQKLDDEVQLIQSVLQEISTKPSAAIDVLAELTSTSSDPLRDQLSTTESTTFGHSITVPLQAEGTVSTGKSLLDNKRGARNLNINNNENENENTEALNNSSETNMQFTGDDGMQNIEEDDVEAQDGSLNVAKSSLQTILSRFSESALYSHEANEIDGEGLTVQKESIDDQDNQHKEDDTELENKNTNILTENRSVSSKDNSLSNERGHESTVESVQSHEASSSMNTLQNQLTTQDENVTDERTEKNISPVDLNQTEITPTVPDEASLSIILNENLTATEPTTVIVDDLPIDLLHVDERDALAIEEVATTVEPDNVKIVHVVIKKQGVELEPLTVEPLEETTVNMDIVEQELLVEEETTAKPSATLINGGDIVKAQNIQNDDVGKETSLQLAHNVNEQAVSEPVETITGRVVEDNAQMNIEEDKLNDDNNRIDVKSSDESEQKDREMKNKSNPTIGKENIQSDDKQHFLNDNQYLIEINNDIGSQTENSTTNEGVRIASVDKPIKESAILQEAEEENENTQSSSTTESTIAQETGDNEKHLQSNATTEQLEQMHISLLSTTHLPIGEVPPTSPNTFERQSTTLKAFEVIDEDDNNTDDPNMVPLLVGGGTGQGDVTASTKGSRSINTQTHHTMLLTQLDDTMAATLFETFPPHNAGRTLNDHMAAESNGGIGKPLPTRNLTEATSASIFSRSGLIIVVCSSIAFMFLLVSVVAFLISFQRQHGTLDIEMQEQRCGKDDLDEEDEEDEEAGTCTKLLEIELPKSTIVTAACEELEECL